MAINYKEEWEKLYRVYGKSIVLHTDYRGDIQLRELMDNQRQKTINNREKLMKEYIKAQMETEIIGADGGYHTVKLEFFGESWGTVPVSKNAFNTWIRNRNKKRKED